MAEFAENKGGEWKKQDCERTACKRLAERPKEMFPNLRTCIGADSLYANKPFFQACEEYRWRYIVRFKEGSYSHGLTDLPLSHRNALATAFCGRSRWRIENQGFAPGHLFSRNCQAMKHHYYLTQIGHMIAQTMDAWKALWEDIRQSKERKHRRILESWKTQRLSECNLETPSRFQIRLE